MEELNQENFMPAKMPQFLKVLCILTFIGTGLGLLGGLYNLIKAPTALEDFERVQELTGNMEGMSGGFMGNMMESARLSAENALPLAITAIGVNLFCLFGALMMWKLRKVGFYVYVCGQLLGIIVPIVLIGFGGVFGGLMALTAVFPIAFIIMYAFNLKHMS